MPVNEVTVGQLAGLIGCGSGGMKGPEQLTLSPAALMQDDISRIFLNKFI